MLVCATLSKQAMAVPFNAERVVLATLHPVSESLNLHHSCCS